MPDFNKKESTYDIGWVPKTRLGQLVYQGKITTMSEALASRHALKEPEIVDILLPEMEDEVLDVNMVQRMTDSGRRVRFAITVVVGNGDGFVGMGRAKGKEVGPTIRNAIDRAKLNIIEIKRGCGSWECGCGNPHTLPFEVGGKCGSVQVTFKPAPRGVGLALGSVAKKVASMAGIEDAWGFAKGHTKTTVNYSFAAFEALRETSRIKVTETQRKNLHIMSGPSQVVYLETSPEELKRLLDEKKKREKEKISEKAKAIAKDAEVVDGADEEPDPNEKDDKKDGKPEHRPAPGRKVEPKGMDESKTDRQKDRPTTGKAQKYKPREEPKPVKAREDKPKEESEPRKEAPPKQDKPGEGDKPGDKPEEEAKPGEGDQPGDKPGAEAKVESKDRKTESKPKEQKEAPPKPDGKKEETE